MSDQYSIKDLPEVPNDKGRYLVSGRTMATIISIIERLWQGDNVKTVGLYKRGIPGGGYTLEAKTGRGGGSSGPHPWMVTMQAKAGAPGEYEATVETESDLLKSVRDDDYQEVTGLGVYFPLITEDVIWLEITIDSTLATTSATVKSYGQGDDEYVPGEMPYTAGGIVEDDGGSPPKQTVARLPIAKTSPGPSGQPVLTQLAYNHAMMWTTVIQGIATSLPVPSMYRRYF